MGRKSIERLIKKMNFIDLKSEYLRMKDEIDEAVKNVLESTAFIMGKDVKLFEQEFAQYLGIEHALGVSSGTDALLVALMAIGIKPGDEVITTPFTFIATAEVIALLGAKPVFVDIDDKTYNIDVTKIEEVITDKTKAIIPVHLYGQSADVDEIMEIAKKHSLVVVEDVAQAMGSEYKDKKCGVIGDIGCFSFFPSKNLGCYGDGGMVVTNNKEYADKMNAIRVHGSAVKYKHEMLGINGRIDTIQAAILRVKLKHFGYTVENRKRVSSLYLEKLKDIEGVIPPFTKDDRTHMYNQFTIRTKQRQEVIKALGEKDIPSAVHYPCPLHLQEVFEYLGYKEGDFPVSEQVSNEVMSLPMFPDMTEEEIDSVVNTIKGFFETK
jgi:UDP-2-acetamido-2-deoxy-ribo-hexuluronate aminotransferase